MQEEVEHRLVVLIENCSKLTARELRRALEKVLAQIKAEADRYTAKKNAQRNAQPRGKMTVRELAAQNRGMQSVEVNDKSIGSFTRVARKYGVDFAPFKVRGENKYLIFFKAPDADAMTAAFTEYTRRQIRQASRPSILQRLELFKSLIRQPAKEKTRHKVPER